VCRKSDDERCGCGQEGTTRKSIDPHDTHPGDDKCVDPSMGFWNADLDRVTPCVIVDKVEHLPDRSDSRLRS